jgi:uncharacterized DUF497 family protein
VRYKRIVPVWNLISEDSRREYGETRFRAVGETGGDILHVAFTWRGTAMRIISVRRASRKEAEWSYGDHENDER